MNSLKLGTKGRLLRENGLVVVMAAMGTFFVALGAHRLWDRPEHLGIQSLLGCGVGAFGAFFLLLVADYVYQHAPRVFIPWVIFLVYLAFTQPHFAVGLGLALWFMAESQLRA